MSKIGYNQEIVESWLRQRAPIRPSPEDMNIYESIMKQGMKTLLLGATPEIRSLAHQYEHELTAVDISEQMYQAVEHLVETKGNSRFVCSDWLTMSFDEQFDLVLADGSINMVPHQYHQKFIENIAKQIKPNGLLVLHLHVMGEPKLKTEQEIIEWSRSTDLHVFSATKHHLDLLFIDEESQVLDESEYMNMIQQLYHRDIITEEEYEAYDRIMAEHNVEIYFLKPHQVEELVKPYFEVEDILYANDYGYYELKPFYCLRRR